MRRNRGARRTRSMYAQFEHAVRDPDITTKVAHRCPACKSCFSSQKNLRKHVCEARKHYRERVRVTVGGWFPVVMGPARPPPRGWWVSTDGSGRKETVDGNTIRVAGWGVVIFRIPIESDIPDYVLHGPVIVQDWDHRWIGAREFTNNTGELSAIGEAMMWLRDEAPDGGSAPV
eukprot:10439282-Karenia_brevis.AAC.1